MTEAEREKLIEKMVESINEIRSFQNTSAEMARAALAVAEPVIAARAREEEHKQLKRELMSLDLCGGSMTEAEREELIRKMQQEILRIMAKRNCIIAGIAYNKNSNNVDEFDICEALDHARAALAVAEPVIREQADNALREENARLRAALKPFAEMLKGNYSHQSDNMPIKAGANQYDLVFVFTLGDLRKAATAIREGGDDE